jgi:hypothetical protein
MRYYNKNCDKLIINCLKIFKILLQLITFTQDNNFVLDTAIFST